MERDKIFAVVALFISLLCVIMSIILWDITILFVGAMFAYASIFFFLTVVIHLEDKGKFIVIDENITSHKNGEVFKGTKAQCLNFIINKPSCFITHV